MPSFDVVSELNLQEVDNAVNNAMKEITTRYDFKNSKSEVKFDKDKLIMLAEDDYKQKAVIDILQSKLVKRGIPLNALEIGKWEPASGQTHRCEVKLIQGIATEKAKEINKFIKENKFKVNSQIQDEKLRVTGKSRDELQEVIAALKSKNFGLPLQFTNFRD